MQDQWQLNRHSPLQTYRWENKYKILQSKTLTLFVGRRSWNVVRDGRTVVCGNHRIFFPEVDKMVGQSEKWEFVSLYGHYIFSHEILRPKCFLPCTFGDLVRSRHATTVSYVRMTCFGVNPHESLVWISTIFEEKYFCTIRFNSMRRVRQLQA